MEAAGVVQIACEYAIPTWCCGLFLIKQTVLHFFCLWFSKLSNGDMEIDSPMTRRKQYPVIDTGLCSRCEGCIAAAKDVFFCNPDTGLISVIWLDKYPEESVDEAIKNCPKKCISWSE